MIVKEHNSIATSKTTASGLAWATTFALAMPDTPPAQPRPHTGIRFMRGFNFNLLMSNASTLGVARPVVDTTIISVISFALMSARMVHSSIALEAYSTAQQIYSLFLSSKLLESE